MARLLPVLLVALLVTIAVTWLLAFGILDALELPIRDVALRALPQEPASSTVVVAIDERSLRDPAFGPWPWPRRVLADIVEKAAALGARAVILDILLAEPRPGDELLVQAMHKVPTIVVSVLDEHGEWLAPVDPIRSAATAAHGHFELDDDGILRRFASTKQSRDHSLTALSIQAASVLTAAAVPVGRSVAPTFRTRPRSIPLISATDLLRSPPLQALKGKLVFVGPTAFALGDRVLTPVSALRPDPGVTVHAAAAESLVRGEEIRPAAPIAAGAVAGLAVGLIVQARRSRRMRLIIAVAFAVVVCGGGLLLLAFTGVTVPFGILLLSVVVATVGVEASSMAEALQQSRRAAVRMETPLGISPHDQEVGPRLEEIATKMAERRRQDAESKRLLAHELKTPLASIRGLTQLMGGFDLTESERRRVASLLEAEAGKLQTMVHALLDLESLGLRDFATSTIVIDLGDLVARRVAFLRASTDRELIVSTEPGLLVRAEAALIERVVDNLVGNALKYSPAPAAVTIAVRHAGTDAAVEVEDHGPGIGEQDRGRIFDRFFRGSTATGTQGLGLGLSLVAEVARWHGGAVALERAAAGGSLFRFTLPAASGVAAIEASDRSDGSDGSDRLTERSIAGGS